MVTDIPEHTEVNLPHLSGHTWDTIDTIGDIYMGHGMTNTRLYRVWSGMKDRCYNKNNKGYHHYGGRGIVVCDEWKHDFLSFYRWAMVAGYDETAPRGQYTIERKNNDGPYSPDNCRWATIKEQERNRRTNVKVDVEGRTMALSEACEELGLNYANERKAAKRRSKGIRRMSEYNHERKKLVDSRVETLGHILQEHPELTNAQLAKEMGLSSRYVQRLKKLVRHEE